MSNTADASAHPRRTTPENLNAIKESANEIAHNELDHVQQVYARGKQRVQGMQLRFEDYVREHPMRTILIAAGAGATLGYLLGRRR